MDNYFLSKISGTLYYLNILLVLTFSLMMLLLLFSILEALKEALFKINTYWLIWSVQTLLNLCSYIQCYLFIGRWSKSGRNWGCNTQLQQQNNENNESDQLGTSRTKFTFKVFSQTLIHFTSWPSWGSRCLDRLGLK